MLYDNAQALSRRLLTAMQQPTEWLNIPPGGIALDVGCGPGSVTASLGRAAGPDGLALGVDISEPMQSQRNQAEYARQTAIVRVQYKAEVDKAQAEAAQAGPLAEAQAQREVLAMRTELPQRAAELRQQELVSEVVKPGLWEPYDGRLSRTVLREPGGAIPSGYSPNTTTSASGWTIILGSTCISPQHPHPG